MCWSPAERDIGFRFAAPNFHSRADSMTSCSDECCGFPPRSFGCNSGAYAAAQESRIKVYLEKTAAPRKEEGTAEGKKEQKKAGKLPNSTGSAAGRLLRFAGRGCVNNFHGSSVAADHLARKALHLFQLRAELQQQMINPRVFELGNTFGDLLGSSHQPGAQSTIGNRVVFERDALFQLRIGQPLLVILVAGGILLDVSDATQFLLGFGFAVAHDGVRGYAEFERRQVPLRAALRQVANLFANPWRGVAMHHVSVALLRDQVLGCLRLASGIDHRTRLRDRLGFQHQVFHAIVLAAVGGLLFLPGLAYNIQPLSGAGVAIVVLIELRAVLARFFRPP